MNETTETVYRFICAYWEKHEKPPTQQEIADGCYLAPSTVRYHLKKLAADGRIQHSNGKRRAIGVSG